MLIGIDANEANLTSRRVGVNQYALGLLWGLSKLTTARNFVVYLKTPPLPDLPPASTRWQYRVIPFPRLWTQTRLPLDLYVHHPRPDVFFSLTHYAPRFCPMPSVVSIMDLGFLKFPDQFTARDLRQLTHWTGYSIKNAEKIITISEFSRRDIVTRYRRSAKDITVVYPGYDSMFDRPAPDPRVLAKYGIKKPYLFFISSLKPSKNIEGLIKAFQKLISPPAASPLKKLTLVISGKKAWDYDPIFQLVKELNLAQKIIFTDFVNEADVPVLTAQAEAFVMPSFYEGFGIPVIQAMAAGTPVVVSRVASLPEVAGPAGIYVDPYSPDDIAAGIRTALSSHRQEYVSAGLNRVKLFDWGKAAQQTLICLQTAAVSR